MSLRLLYILLSSTQAVSFSSECVSGEGAGAAGTWEEVNFNEGLEKKTCWPEGFRGSIVAGDRVSGKGNQTAPAHTD